MTQTHAGARTAGFVLGFILALLLVVVGGYAYMRFGHLPVATTDPAFPMEKQIVHVPMKARIDREMEQPTIAANEETFVAGAHIYMAECASCHGTPGKDVPFAKYMYPAAPQLWKSHRAGVVGVSDDDAGETYWKVKNGLRLTGMPGFNKMLSEQQMWEVTLLLKNADKPLSPALSTELGTAVTPGTTPPSPAPEVH